MSIRFRQAGRSTGPVLGFKPSWFCVVRLGPYENGAHARTRPGALWRAFKGLFDMPELPRH